MVTTTRYDTIRYDKSCYFNVRSKADVSLNLPHGKEEGKKLRKRICWDVSVDIPSWESAIVVSCIIFYLNKPTFYLRILYHTVHGEFAHTKTQYERAKAGRLLDLAVRGLVSWIHRLTVTSFCSISMSVDFCRHLVGKNSEKCLPLW